MTSSKRDPQYIETFVLDFAVNLSVGRLACISKKDKKV